MSSSKARKTASISSRSTLRAYPAAVVERLPIVTVPRIRHTGAMLNGGVPQTLMLVPTERERRQLAGQPGFGTDAPCELCGFGPVAAAAHAASLIARHQPERVILAGIAGTFDPTGLPVGTAAVFPSVVMHGVGVGVASGFVSAAALGWRHWPTDGRGPEHSDELTLHAPVPPAAGQLLTCCTPSTSPEEARRRLEQYPDAVAEDMEGFAVALACRLAGVPLAIARGISNEVGDRAFERWEIPTALDAAWLIVRDLVGRRHWDTTP